MDIIVTASITLVSFLIGYFIGREQPTRQEVIKSIKKKLDISPVGVVMNPTQQDILKRTDPMTKRIEEGKDEMRKVLQNIIEKG